MTLIETGPSVRYNDAPLSASTTDNWVARRGGLPPMVRAIARALMRSGHSESGAISLAIGAVKRWAAGGGKVHPSTRARAAAAVAHWEAIKASTGRSDEDMIRRSVSAGELRKTQDMDDLQVRRTMPAQGAQGQQPAAKGKAAPAAGKKGANGKALSGSHAPGHPFYGNQHIADANQAGVTVGGKGGSTGVIAKPSSGGGGSAASKAAAAAAKAAAATAAYQAAGTALANATLAAQKSSEAHDNAMAKLAEAGQQAGQDKLFAEEKLPPNRPNQNTPALDAAALSAIDKSSSDRIAAAKAAAESARISHEMNLNSLAAAQTKYSAAKAAAGVRSDGMDIVVVRSWATWDAEHRLNKGDRVHYHTSSGRLQHAVIAEHRRGPGAIHLVAVKHISGVGNSHEYVSNTGAVVDIHDLTKSADSDFFHPSGPKTPGYAKNVRADFVGETTGQGADKFLPAGPSKKQSAAVTAKLKEGDTKRHRFKGDDLDHCAECGQPLLSMTHGSAPGQPIAPVSREAKLVRHAGPGHAPVYSGHVKGVPARHARAAAAAAAGHMSAVEGPLEGSLKSLFSQQRKSTLSRLTGDRGKRMLRDLKLRADEAPPPDEEEPSIVGPSAIFDSGFWAGKTAEVLTPHLTTAGNLAADSVRNQISLDPMTDDSTSLGHLHDIVTQRATNAANYVSGTTARELTGALQEGVANGEGMADIAKRVNDVFDNADMVRAKRIAQTEVVGAYNEGALAYASGLPSDTIGTKRWLSHHDARTRPTHRMADGQEQPVNQAFYVGGAAMQSPGDKGAPVGEWINCRCSMAFMPPGMAYNGIAAAAEAYVAGLKAKPPVPSSPYVVSGVES